jgi:Ca-activated chloride channel homolog
VRRLILTLLPLFSFAIFAQDSAFQLRVNVDLVTLDVGVSGPEGKALTDLKREEFEILEDGQPREIKAFASIETPYNVVSLLDCTSSVRNAWPMLTQAYTTFLKNLRDQDRVSLAYFGSTANVLLDWTSRNAGMSAKASQMEARVCGTTNVYGALEWSLTKLERVNGRKGVVVFTDGIHTVGQEWKRAAVGGMDVVRVGNSRDDKPFQAILQKVRQSDVVFYFIAVNTDLNPTNLDTQLNRSTEYSPLALYNLQQFRLRMQQVAEASGGRVAFPRKASDVIPLYERIASELGSSYSLSYTPVRTTPGTYHGIQVRVRGQGLSVRQSREGYTEP